MNHREVKKSKTSSSSQPFSPKDVCKLIKTCQKSGVSELKLGGLELHFVPKVKKPEPKAEEKADVSGKDVEEKALLQEELKLRDTQVDNLLLESPSEYERRIIEGDLEDERKTSQH